jgi:thiol-disulfide isomerase/thioredoxin
MTVADGALDQDRRRFVGRLVMAIGVAHMGVFGTAEPKGTSRELAAIGRASEWLNSPRPTPESLTGKVVLVQFGTYTCINWLRTLPYIRAWSQKYRQGFALIGVNTPEFEFEKNVDSVRRAVRQMRIEYPVVIDNDYSIWRAFNNQYWPALYFLDVRGRVRHHHFGEGEYESSERAIQQLLAEMSFVGGDQSVVSAAAHGIEAPADWNNLRSSENYVGYARTENFASPGGVEPDRRRLYAAPKRMTLNQWALVGEWTMGRQATVLNGPTGRIVCRFHARDLHLVMSPPRQGGSVRFRVSIDGQPPAAAHGGDADEVGNGVVVEPRLYQLVRQPQPIVDREFAIEFFDSGVEAFAFTFG